MGGFCKPGHAQIILDIIGGNMLHDEEESGSGSQSRLWGQTALGQCL